MQYEGIIIRPPSEANSIILQVTAGCSHNKCTFCGAYKGKKFKSRSDQIDSTIDFASRYCRRQNRVFLADGDALILPFDQLIEILKKIRKNLPWVNRVSLYGNCRAIRSKSCDELLILKSLGLDRVYLGLESGDDIVLQSINKGETARTMEEAAEKIRLCELFLSVTFLLGIGGTNLSQRHSLATAKVLNQMAPNQIAALTVIPLPGTEFHQAVEKNEVILPGPYALLRELQTVIELLTVDRVQFYSNHASNYLPLKGRLQRDKDRLLSTIDGALSGAIELIDEQWRDL